MAWSVVGNEVYLTEDGVGLSDNWNSVPTADLALFDAGVWATSTATVPYDADAAWLFDIRQVQIANSAGTFVSPATREQGNNPSMWNDMLVLPRPAYTFGEAFTGTSGVTVTEHLGRIPIPISTSATINLDTAAQITTGALPEWTSVPRLYANALSLTYDAITGYPWWSLIINSGFGGPAPFTVTEPLDFYVVFKDPCVVKVPESLAPEGAWLMVVGRFRVLSSAASDAEAASNLCNPAQSIGDIVAFVSNNTEFVADAATGRTLRGPYLLVDSLAAVSLKQRFRLWLSVPGAAFAKDSTSWDPPGDNNPVLKNLDGPDLFLYVYYVIEKSVDNTGAPPFDYVSIGTWADEYDRWAGGSFDSDGAGIAVKRFLASDLLGNLLNSDYLTSLVLTQQDAWNKNDALPGDLLGGVRVWIPDGGLGSGLRYVRSFDDVFAATVPDPMNPGAAPVDVTPKAVDPEAILDEAGALHLLFATFPRRMFEGVPELITPDNGWGIWHGVALPSGLSLRVGGGAEVSTVHGKDIVIRPKTLGGDWRDLVAPSNAWAADPRRYIDPNIIRDAAGNWVVLAGCERFVPKPRYLTTSIIRREPTTTIFHTDPLTRIEGAYADLSWPWTAAFR